MENIKYLQLRNKYNTFKYNSFSYNFDDKNINIVFEFEIENLTKFKPTHTIPFSIKDIDYSLVDNLVFHIGLIEMISYYKLTCAPNIYINYFLDNEQISFLKKLFINGLSEFYYTNNIEIVENFANIIVNNDNKIISNYNKNITSPNKTSKALLNVGGGKDSIVSLEILKDKLDLYPFAINPRGAIFESIEISNLKDKSIYSKRSLDPNMLELNKQGFLNGHTPFSSLVSFTSLLCAYLNDIYYIILSNEASANESTIVGTNINHQYSKSFEYEMDFFSYQNKYLKTGIYYFSFLRPLHEIKIAQLFSKFTKYHKVFKSCNVASKTNSWCSNCSKCLFVFIILCPFIEYNTLVEIFNKDLLNDKNLKDVFDKLIGKHKEKPFECVGSVDEVNYSLNLLMNKLDNNKYPILLNYYSSLNIDIKNFNINNYDLNNNLPKYFKDILWSYL